jgi:hypothetical protein
MEQFEENIYNLLLGEKSIPVKLRLKDNVDNDYKILLEELEKLTEKYSGKNNIPKKLGYAFLDISNYFEFSDRLYSEKEIDNIEDMKNNIMEKLIEFYET